MQAVAYAFVVEENNFAELMPGLIEIRLKNQCKRESAEFYAAMSTLLLRNKSKDFTIYNGHQYKRNKRCVINTGK